MQDQHISHSDIARFAEDRVNLKNIDVKAYRDQANRLREKLEAYIAEHPDFDLVKMRQSGSVAKGTALKTINDMDVAVYVKAGRAPGDEKELISWLLERLREAYGKTLKPEQFTAQHHCVTVSFAGSGLDVDVVPVLYEGDPDDRGYLITKDTGQRILTSIKLHLEFTRNRKNRFPKTYRQMVRLVKWWARLQKLHNEGFRFKSFMAELLLANLFDNGFEGADYAEGLQNFFAYLITSRLEHPIVFTDYYKAGDAVLNGSPIQIFDPVNPANNVASRYSLKERDTIIDAAADALDSISFARRATTKGLAVAEWQKILGPSFRGG